MHRWLIGFAAVALMPTFSGPAQAESVPEPLCSMKSQIDYDTGVATITVDRDVYSSWYEARICPPIGTKVTYGGDQYTLAFAGNTGTVNFALKDGVNTATYGDLSTQLSFSRLQATLTEEPRVSARRQTVQWWLTWRSFPQLRTTVRFTAVDGAGLVTSKVLQYEDLRWVDSGVTLGAKYSKPGPVTITVVVEDAIGVVTTETQQAVVPGPPASPRVRGKVENNYRVLCGASVSDTGEPRQPRKPGYRRSYFYLRWTSNVGKRVKSRIQVKGSQLSGTYKVGRLKTTFFKSFRGPAKGTYKARVKISNEWGTSQWSQWKKIPVKTSKTCA